MASFVAPEELPLGYDDTQTLVARLNLLAPFKPKLDVVVVGKAYAPPASEADRLIARIRIGDFSKAVSITGDRLWMRDGARWGSSPPRPFSQMLLAPERAIRSAENPVGLDPAAIPVEGRLAMPNLEPAGGSFSAVTGTVAPTAPSRHNLLDAAGVYWVAALEAGRAPGPLPEGFNFQFFNVAPQDQQVVNISPGDAVVLENLHPMHPVFTTKLPSVLPRIVGVDGTTGSTFEVPIRCDTVWLDGDRETAWIVYRGTAAIARPDQPLALRVEVDQYKRPEPQQLSTSTMLQTQQGGGHAVMPFAGGHSSAPAYGAYGQYAQPQQAGLQRPIASEVTSELPAEGSYPPPPPRHITQEIELEAPVAEAPGGLPFGGGGFDHRSVARTEPGWAGNGFAASPPGYPRGLAPQPTMALELPTRHETMPPAPPSMALPFSPSALAVEPTAPHSIRTLYVQRASPGPIPEIGPTPAPVIAFVMREPAPPSMSELTAQPTLLSVSKQPAAAPPAAPPMVAPPAPVAPPIVPTTPPPAPVAPPTVPTTPPPAPIAPPAMPSAPPPAPVAPPIAPTTPPPAPVAPPIVPTTPPPAPVAPPIVQTPPATVAPPATPSAPPPPVSALPSASPSAPVAPPVLSALSAIPVAPPVLSPPRIPMAPPVPSAPMRVDEAPHSARVPPPAPSVPAAIVVPPSLRPATLTPAPSTDPPMPPPLPKPSAVPLNLVPPPKPNRPVDAASAEPKVSEPAPPPIAAQPAAQPPPAPLPSQSNASFADDPTPPADEPFGEVAPPAQPTPAAEPAPPKLEDAAALRARLSFKDADKVAVLAQFGLDDASWTTLEREHLKAIDEASQAGDNTLLERYDDAYLEALNQLRGVIDELGYARLQYARESGSLGTTLEELRVQRNDLMRLERTWRRRLAANKELAERVEDELERLRGGGA